VGHKPARPKSFAAVVGERQPKVVAPVTATMKIPGMRTFVLDMTSMDFVVFAKFRLRLEQSDRLCAGRCGQWL
jgi:hypothetical protein